MVAAKYHKNKQKIGSGSSSVSRAVDYDTNDQQFESRHHDFYLS